MIDKLTTFVESHPFPALIAACVVVAVVGKLDSSDLAFLLLLGFLFWWCGT